MDDRAKESGRTSRAFEAEQALAKTIVALAAITDPRQTSMRYRDKTCVRFVACDVLTELKHHDVLVGTYTVWEPIERSS